MPPAGILASLGSTKRRAVRLQATRAADKFGAGASTAAAAAAATEAELRQVAEASAKKGTATVRKRRAEAAKDAAETREKAEEVVAGLFRDCLALRFRDVDADVRAAAVTGLGAWAAAHPPLLLVEAHLKYVHCCSRAQRDADSLCYSLLSAVLFSLCLFRVRSIHDPPTDDRPHTPQYVGWALCDEHHVPRRAAIEAIAALLETAGDDDGREAQFAAMHALLGHFAGRIADMALDARSATGALALDLCATLAAHTDVMDEAAVFEPLYSLVVDEDRDVRLAAGRFVATHLLSVPCPCCAAFVDADSLFLS